MTVTIFFDTETTGLPKNKYNGGLKEPNNWPDIVSICWMVFENKTFVKKHNFIIKPEGWSIPQDASDVHGITEAIAYEKGSSLKDVLELFHKDIENCDQIVAHNLAFDKNVVLAAYKWRLHITPNWPTKAEICTTQKSKWEMKLPSRYPKSNDPYKYPNLNELYKDTFGEEAPNNAHNAERDVDVLQKIFWKRWNV